MFTKFSYKPHTETKWRSLKQFQYSEIQNVPKWEISQYEQTDVMANTKN